METLFQWSTRICGAQLLAAPPNDSGYKNRGSFDKTIIPAHSGPFEHNLQEAPNVESTAKAVASFSFLFAVAQPRPLRLCGILVTPMKAPCR
jgi:hypothetical protein